MGGPWCLRARTLASSAELGALQEEEEEVDEPGLMIAIVIATVVAAVMTIEALHAEAAAMMTAVLRAGAADTMTIMTGGGGDETLPGDGGGAQRVFVDGRHVETGLGEQLCVFVVRRTPQ